LGGLAGRRVALTPPAAGASVRALLRGLCTGRAGIPKDLYAWALGLCVPEMKDTTCSLHRESARAVRVVGGRTMP